MGWFLYFLHWNITLTPDTYAVQLLYISVIFWAIGLLSFFPGLIIRVMGRDSKERHMAKEDSWHRAVEAVDYDLRRRKSTSRPSW